MDNVSILALLDFSSALSTILTLSMETIFTLTLDLLQSFSSHLTDHTQYVSLSDHYSAFAPVHFDVRQGPVFGPMLFRRVYQAFVYHYCFTHYHVPFIC